MDEVNTQLGTVLQELAAIKAVVERWTSTEQNCHDLVGSFDGLVHGGPDLAHWDVRSEYDDWYARRPLGFDESREQNFVISSIRADAVAFQPDAAVATYSRQYLLDLRFPLPERPIPEESKDLKLECVMESPPYHAQSDSSEGVTLSSKTIRFDDIVEIFEPHSSEQPPVVAMHEDRTVLRNTYLAEAAAFWLEELSLQIHGLRDAILVWPPVSDKSEDEGIEIIRQMLHERHVIRNVFPAIGDLTDEEMSNLRELANARLDAEFDAWKLSILSKGDVNT